MGKGGVVLGVLALLVGTSGLGFGLVTWINQGQQDTNFWFDYKEEEFVPTDLIFTTIPELYVIINLDTPASVYMLFTTSTKILPNPATFADMLFYFWIDGSRLLNPFTRAGPYQGDATYQYYPVVLQHSQILTGGVHNISVVVFSEIAGNLIRESALAINLY
ncbi:MAG: hypothetical protein ACFFE5_09200 [Candidatus Thorarchaeota archaeon]